VLLARIRNLLQRRYRRSAGERNKTEVLKCGALVMDQDSHKVTFAGQEIILTKREYDLLEYLLVNQAIVLTREKILEQVWGYDYIGDTNVVDVYVRYLRSKIDDPFRVRLIHTVRGVGYVLRQE